MDNIELWKFVEQLHEAGQHVAARMLGRKLQDTERENYAQWLVGR